MLTPLPSFLVCMFLPPVSYPHPFLTCTSFLLISRCFLSLSSNLYVSSWASSSPFRSSRAPLRSISPLCLSLSRSFSHCLQFFPLYFSRSLLLCNHILFSLFSSSSLPSAGSFTISQSSFLFFPSFFRLICACFPDSASLSFIQDCWQFLQSLTFLLCYMTRAIAPCNSLKECIEA